MKFIIVCRRIFQTLPGVVAVGGFGVVLGAPYLFQPDFSKGFPDLSWRQGETFISVPPQTTVATEPHAVPEPSSMILFATACVAAIVISRKRKQ